MKTFASFSHNLLVTMHELMRVCFSYFILLVSILFYRQQCLGVWVADKFDCKKRGLGGVCLSSHHDIWMNSHRPVIEFLFFFSSKIFFSIFCTFFFGIWLSLCLHVFLDYANFLTSLITLFKIVLARIMLVQSSFPIFSFWIYDILKK